MFLFYYQKGTIIASIQVIYFSVRHENNKKIAPNMKPVPSRLIVEWVIKSWQAISNETVAKSMKSCGPALAVDGTEDDLISCSKEGKKCIDGRALLQTQMLNLNDGNLHENPFEISGEDMAAAAPSFSIIEEDDDDDYIDLEII